MALIELEEKNTTAIDILNNGGFSDKVFRKYAAHKSTQSNVPIKESNTRARQDAVAAIKFQGDLFRLTKENTPNTKYYFISEERQRHEAEIKDLETKKQNPIAVQDLNGKVLVLIEEFDKMQGKYVYELEDAKMLPVTTLRVLCNWKLQKKANGKK